MAIPIRARIKVKRLKPIFDTQDPELGPILARMCVLYEDLRFETKGASIDKISDLDETGASLRRIYFLRRSTITLVEFRGTLQRLTENEEFKKEISNFDEESAKRWNEANEFFGKNHPLIKAVRNDCGGHYKLSTAIEVVKKMDAETVGPVEVNFGPSGEDVRTSVETFLLTTLTRPVESRDEPQWVFTTRDAQPRCAALS